MPNFRSVSAVVWDNLDGRDLGPRRSSPESDRTVDRDQSEMKGSVRQPGLRRDTLTFTNPTHAYTSTPTRVRVATDTRQNVARIRLERGWTQAPESYHFDYDTLVHKLSQIYLHHACLVSKRSYAILNVLGSGGQRKETEGVGLVGV